MSSAADVSKRSRQETEKRTSIEEHVSNGGRLDVHLERMAGQDDSLGNNSFVVGVQEGAHGNQVWYWKGVSQDLGSETRNLPVGFSDSRSKRQLCLPKMAGP